MGSLRIALVHYHLRPGGVTSVLARTLSALAPWPVQAVVLCGDEAGARHAWPCPVRVIDGLDYHGSGSPAGLRLRMEEAAREALGGPPDLWHVHNHALGKQVALPVAVAELARRGAPLLLHLHDFAEDGRPAQYRGLREELPAAPGASLDAVLYPLGPHIHYAVLNGRDAAFLTRAGAPPGQVSVLPNPVRLDAPAPGLARVPGLMVYPTRAIRRKNVGEFLLWSVLGPAGTRWQTTLEPASAADLPGYARWKALAAELKLPVEFGVGVRDPRPLADRLAEAEGVVTTSVAEGFGLSFLEPWLAGCPVWGRDLPDITADVKAQGLDLGALYERLEVPLAWVGKDRLQMCVADGLRRLHSAYGRTCVERDVDAAWAEMIRSDRVEFGRLDEDLQASVIRRLAAQVADRYALRPARLMRPLSPTVLASNRCLVRSCYSEERYGERLWALYQTIAGRTAAGPLGALDAGRLLDLFLDPRRFTLLRT